MRVGARSRAATGPSYQVISKTKNWNIIWWMHYQRRYHSSLKFCQPKSTSQQLIRPLNCQHAESRSRDSLAQIDQPSTNQHDRLNKLEEAVLQLTQQPTALSLPSHQSQKTSNCFKCGCSGHTSRNCCTWSIECFKCGGRGQCWSQGNGKGVSQDDELGALPILRSAHNLNCIPAVSQNSNIVKTACVLGTLFNMYH